MLRTPKLKELSFLVYGLGLSGISVIRFFKKNKIKKFEVWDDKEKYLLKKYRSKNLKKTLSRVNYIVLSPGVSLLKNKALRKYKKKIITDIDLFYLSKNKIKSIVVTGTNGKSTTCKLIENLLRKNKFKCSLGGNIGKPILDLKFSNNSYVIIEASSFQLSHSQFIRPDFAFFLNLTTDHLDWHGSMNSYLNSKLKIFQHQTKNHFAFANKNIKQIFKKRKYSSKFVEPKTREYKKIKNKIKNNYLISKINDENMSYVYSLSRIFKISEKSFVHSMKSFKGLSLRFEIFLKKKNVMFINDSKATSFVASSSAISSLSNIYWIIGGLPKKGDKIKLLNLKKNIVKCYLIGKNIKFFKRQIKNTIIYSITKNLRNSIIQIFKDMKLQKKGDKSVLLSPAAASFDQFKNFEERGDQFKKLCKIYAGKYF